MPATISDLETPALLIDLDRLEANLDRVAAYANKHGLRLRPHTKTHKSPLIGRMQLQRGASGLTVAKVGEAEVMTHGSSPDLLVAYPVWGDAKWERLVEVAKRAPVTVSLDSIEVAEGLGHHAARAGIEIGVLVEADLGMRRCGLRPGPALRDLARSVAKIGSVRLEGLMFYPGHVNLASPEGKPAWQLLGKELDEALDWLHKDGLPTQIVSGGSTPTLFHSHDLPALTEIRPGTYVFNDRSQVAMAACTFEDCAATIMATVVSTAVPDSAVIDGGSKTFTSDPERPPSDGCFGTVLGMPEARFHKMNEEHGLLDLRQHTGPRPKVGDRVRIVPNHVCVAVNMHEKAYGVSGERVDSSWPIEGRGKLQ